MDTYIKNQKSTYIVHTVLILLKNRESRGRVPVLRMMSTPVLAARKRCTPTTVRCTTATATVEHRGGGRQTSTTAMAARARCTTAAIVLMYTPVRKRCTPAPVTREEEDRVHLRGECDDGDVPTDGAWRESIHQSIER